MDVGKLNKRLTIRTNSESTDEGGGLVDSFADTITVWGSVIPLRGSEREKAAAIDADVNHRITLRYNSRLTPDDEIVYGNRTFRPSSVINIDERSRVTEVMATEVI